MLKWGSPHLLAIDESVMAPPFFLSRPGSAKFAAGVRTNRMTFAHAGIFTSSADQGLQKLIEGNRRFTRGEARFPTLCKETLADLAKGQQPFATILGCSDSRVPPELIFDANFGELFIVRVAGNVISPEVAGSLQYAGAHLHTPLFVVLGHEGCGAVSAALKTLHEGDIHLSRIHVLVERILPALADSNGQLTPAETMSRAVESNVLWTVRQILQTPEGRARAAEGVMKIVGAIYEI